MSDRDHAEIRRLRAELDGYQAGLRNVEKENERLRRALERIADDDCGTWDQAVRYSREVLS